LPALDPKSKSAHGTYTDFASGTGSYPAGHGIRVHALPEPQNSVPIVVVVVVAEPFA